MESGLRALKVGRAAEGAQAEAQRRRSEDTQQMRELSRAERTKGGTMRLKVPLKRRKSSENANPRWADAGG